MTLSSPDFWVLVAFALLIGLGGRRLYVYITQFLDTYSQQVASQLEDVTRLHDEALSLLKTYEAKYDTALTQVEEILAFSEKEIEHVKALNEQEYLDFKEQKEKMFQERLELDKKEILSKLRSETVAEALKIVEKTLLEDDKMRENLTKEAIEELSQQDLQFDHRL
jgi:F-type H+-transporting ATPase subunit b